MPDLEAVVARATRIVVGAEGPHVDPSRTIAARSEKCPETGFDRRSKSASGHFVQSGAIVRLVVARPPTPPRLYLQRSYVVVPLLRHSYLTGKLT